MLDYQRIVDDVRNSLWVSGPDAASTVRDTAAAYTYACEEVQERLRRCAELLKAGLRTEALQQCDVEPHLLDVVAALDFPERDVWVQFAAQFGVTPPPPLQMVVASELNEAYAVEQPIATLLARHRLLALAHSPLKLRMNTLRELARLDADNPVWGDDLQLFERERMKQIQKEANVAASAGDTATIVELADELQPERWSKSPPPALFELVYKFRSKLVTRHARRQLEKAAADMDVAYSALDMDRMRSARDRWVESLPDSDVREDEQLSEQMAPALEWLADYEAREEQKREHESAVIELERALDEETSETQLDRLYHAATRFGFDLPPTLDQRLRSRTATLQMNTGRTFRLRLAIGLAVALALAVLVGFVTKHQMYRAELANHAATFKGLLEENKLSEAQQYSRSVAEKSPGVMASPELQSLVADLREQVTQEDARRVRFTGLLKEAHIAVAGINDWETSTRADQVVSEATKVARRDSEKADVVRAQLQLGDRTQQLQQQENRSFTSKLATLRGRVRDAEAESLTLDERHAQIRELRSELIAFDAASERVTEALRSQTKPLFARLDALAQTTTVDREQQLAIDQITRATGDTQSFAKSLAAYATRFPNSARAPDFRRVQDERGLWDGLAKYTDLADTWAKHDHAHVDPEKAKELISSANEVLTALASYPDARVFKARIAYLEAISRRAADEDDEPLIKKLQSVLSKPWIADLYMIQLTGSDGKLSQRYYVRKQPNLESNSVQFKYVLNFDLDLRQLSVGRDKVAYAGLAPQSKLSQQLAAEIENVASGWEPTMFKALVTIKDNSDTDPLPRLALFRQTLDVACQGSVPLTHAFKRHVDLIAAASINPLANWLEPRNDEADIARAKARSVLDGLPSMSTAGKIAAQELRNLSHPVGTRYRWIGWLRQDDDSQWRCAGNSYPKETGAVVIVRRATSSESVAIEQIGTLQNGTATIVGAPASALIEGRPVFVVVPADRTRNPK